MAWQQTLKTPIPATFPSPATGPGKPVQFHHSSIEPINVAGHGEISQSVAADDWQHICTHLPVGETATGR